MSDLSLLPLIQNRHRFLQRRNFFLSLGHTLSIGFFAFNTHWLEFFQFGFGISKKLCRIALVLLLLNETVLNCCNLSALCVDLFVLGLIVLLSVRLKGFKSELSSFLILFNRSDCPFKITENNFHLLVL